jgi:diguanylate cyclase (GGDEF)-like protein/PAS domain S-box-containing protein
MLLVRRWKVKFGKDFRQRRLRSRIAASGVTIRSRILIAFLIMSVITGALGGYAAISIRNAGLLVEKTFDQSLMSINYARAAAADFAGMRATFARLWIATDSETRAALSDDMAALSRALDADIGVARQRSQSVRAVRAADRVIAAANAWQAVSTRLADGNESALSWDTLDSYARSVDEQIDLLVNYTAGDGFLYRQSARAAVERDLRFNIGATALALVLSALVAFALARRIVGPVGVASAVAERIAAGRLDGIIPRGGADELGALLAAMQVMRDNIKAMMDREVAQRRSAQARLADALEHSQEGVVVVGADDVIELANAQAAELLGVSLTLLSQGTPLSSLDPQLRAKVRSGELLMRREAGIQDTGEALMADGRWLRVSRSPTRHGGFIVLFSDISRSKEQEKNLRETNMMLDVALENMSQGLCLFDAQNRVEVFNRRFLEIFKFSQGQIRPGMSLRELAEVSVASGNHTSASIDRLVAATESLLRGGGPGPNLMELKDERIISCVFTRTADGRCVATYDDVTERRRTEAKITHMARHDALTNLPNRVQFRDDLALALARGERLTVLFLDLDRFKSVNDTLGHSVGDVLLCAVTERLQRVVRGVDTVARLGGDEFAILQRDAKPSEARELAAQIIKSLCDPFDILGHQVIIGTSIGIATAPSDGNDADQLLRNADMALYRAKADGRGDYHFFRPEMDAQLQERRVLELDLRKAMLANQFVLHYQPLVQAATGEVTGFEALVRWNHPERGLVMPDRFISVAEEIGLIVPLGDWVLKQACRDAASWPAKFSVAVNLSAAQFRNPTLALSVVAALGQSGLSSSRLELEITESVLLLQDRAVLEALHQIRHLGVRVCMDDFGTGYSSLSYLRSFPFDKIKIDRSFIGELGKDKDALAIIRAILRLSSSLGIRTTAEGVETEEQMDILREESCDELQGYLFSRPKPAAEIPELLKTFRPRVRAA